MYDPEALARQGPPIVSPIILPPKSSLTASRPVIKIHDIKPERIKPNGDRYVVEVADFDETILLGQLLIKTAAVQINPNDPQADPTIENRGVIGGIIVEVGNGHLLGIPDFPNLDDQDFRYTASVPMFFEPGDVVFIDYNYKGRALKILGREVRIVNQMDVLAKVEGVKYERDDNGDWKQVDCP